MKLAIQSISCNLKSQCHGGLCLSVSQPADPNATLSDHILSAVLTLLRKEVSEHGRHLQQYFHLFLMYLNLGTPEVSVGLFMSSCSSLSSWLPGHFVLTTFFIQFLNGWKLRCLVGTLKSLGKWLFTA